MSELLQLRHHAVRDAWNALGASHHETCKREGPRGSLLTFGVQAVHHPANELQLILQAEVDEVGIDENAVGGHERSVVREEERGGDLGSEGGCMVRRCSQYTGYTP